jgi:hypothetical protein
MSEKCEAMLAVASTLSAVITREARTAAACDGLTDHDRIAHVLLVVLANILGAAATDGLPDEDIDGVPAMCRLQSPKPMTPRRNVLCGGSFCPRAEEASHKKPTSLPTSGRNC